MKDTKASYEEFMKELSNKIEEEIKMFTRQLLERLMKKEREIYLEEDPRT
jgi:hypothetical protein